MNQEYPLVINGGLLKTGKLRDEWFVDLEEPGLFIENMKTQKYKPDIFTFWQRLPNIEPRYDYFMEKEGIAVLELSTYDHWWQKQLNPKTRNVIRKSLKSGVEVKRDIFNDNLVSGIVNIFNETPVRQGRPFWHYQKPFEKVKEEMSDRLDMSEFIGAYWKGELIGFIKLLYLEEYTMMVEIISRISHRDKSPNNSLISKAVEICCDNRVRNLVYSRWLEGTLGDFKRHNGFIKVELPRYYVPITSIGNYYMHLNLHHGIKGILPGKVLSYLKNTRNLWYLRKST